ncbi:MAG: LacI family DNA-binding transcriptional regulator [Pirellulales bacterium]|nr:LacI family DNA-binding transcriptional regulator [Pirellulales bacterium]
MRVTLREVASRAELSVSTASRALNGHPALREETIRRVRQIAGEMRYRRVRSHRRTNPVDSVLAGRSIAVLSIGLDRSLSSMPVTSEAFLGTEDALVDAGAKSQLFHMPDLSQLPRDLRLDRIDGIVLTGAMLNQFATDCDTDAVRQLRRLPSVWVVGEPPGAWGDAVVAGDYEVGTGAAEQLVANGHHHLAFLNPVTDNLMFIWREDGFLSAARRLGAEARSFCQSPSGGWTIPLKTPLLAFEEVQSLVDQILDCKPRPTAVFTAADSVAGLVYCALGMRGLRVGHDISIIAGNNTPGLLSVPYPHLATFDIHARTMGILAVRQLALQLSERNRDAHIPVQVKVKPTYLPGESVCDLTR